LLFLAGAFLNGSLSESEIKSRKISAAIYRYANHAGSVEYTSTETAFLTTIHKRMLCFVLNTRVKLLFLDMQGFLQGDFSKGGQKRFAPILNTFEAKSRTHVFAKSRLK
jgi:hypothetical protein